MDVWEFLTCIIIGFVVVMLFSGLITLLTTPSSNPNYVYRCRYGCQQLKNTANSKCDEFDVQECFSDCLELMIE